MYKMAPKLFAVLGSFGWKKELWTWQSNWIYILLDTDKWYRQDTGASGFQKERRKLLSYTECQNAAFNPPMQHAKL